MSYRHPLHKTRSNMMVDYESTWFCSEVCFGSRTGVRQIPPDARNNKTSPFVSALLSSCFSMSGIACFGWALGTLDMWRRVLRKLAAHEEQQEPVHDPHCSHGGLPGGQAVRWVAFEGGGYWGLDVCAWGPHGRPPGRGQPWGRGLWRGAALEVQLEQFWVGGIGWNSGRLTTGLVCRQCQPWQEPIFQRQDLVLKLALR